MVQIIDGVIKKGKTNSNAMGGTEILAHKLVDHVKPEYLNGVQIISSRVECELSPDHVRVFWAHDLPGDPASEFLHKKSEQDKFHKFVFVSNWQMQNYIARYNLPWSKCIVMLNAIEPIPDHEKPTDKINFIYYSTPHRGLELLVPVFDRLSQENPNIHLDVYSSFRLYGWGQRDEPYQKMFDYINQHPHMTNHGTVSNEKIREALTNAHIMLYPSIWQETSCLCLMEAMSAGVACVHSNYGALYETAANWTVMYGMHEDFTAHASTAYSIASQVLKHMNSQPFKDELHSAKNYTNMYYSWGARGPQWERFLEVLKMNTKDTKLPQEGESFTYSTT